MITSLIIGLVSAVAGAVTAIAMARKARIDQETKINGFVLTMEEMHKRAVKAERAARRRTRDNQPKSKKDPR